MLLAGSTAVAVEAAVFTEVVEAMVAADTGN
jgi:hypothetical protein